MSTTAVPFRLAPPAPAPTPTRRRTARPILVAADGREDVRPALRVAAALAERLEVPVQVLAALEALPDYGGPESARGLHGLECERAAIVYEAMRRRMREAAAGVTGHGASPWPVQVALGAPTRTITDVAAERNAELVLVGDRFGIGWDEPTHSLLGLQRALDIAGTGGVPVLAAGPRADGTIRRAVVGVDFGPASVRAAALACRLLSPGGTLSLVHVKPRLELNGPAGDVWNDACERQLAELFRRLTAALRGGGVAPFARGGHIVGGEGIPCDGRRDVTVGTATLVGDPADELMEYARHVGADLVALGTHAEPRAEPRPVGRVTADVAYRVAARLPGSAALLAP